MIELKNIYLKKKGNGIYFCSIIKIADKEEELWYSTSISNEKYISTSNADAFILFIFIYAVFENLEFKSNVPISKRLKFGLLEVILPAFQEMGYKAIPEQFSFDLEDKSIYPEANAVGTAMSFGVDSFYTYIQGLKSIEKLNCLTLFNAGAFGQYGGEKAAELFETMKNRVHDFAIQSNMGFVWVDTNLNEIFQMPFVKTHTFRNFASVLVFQKLFKFYYYASGISATNFKLNKLDPAYYDLLNSKVISSNSLEFHISGLFEDRIEKTKMIANNKITYDHLNVCLITPDNKDLKDNKNCSKCIKCARTMVSLDILGHLDQYQKVFDLSIYKKNRNKYLAELLYKKFRSRDVLAKEIFKEAKERNYTIPVIVYYYSFLRVFQPIVRKIKNA
jgi:hypothetical protein